VDRERIGRLLMTLSAVIALLGVPLADDRMQATRVLVASGCLVVAALVLLLLAPRPATAAERRARARRAAARRPAEVAAPMTMTYRVPQPRTEAEPEDVRPRSRRAA
jgi:hypothetical protein